MVTAADGSAFTGAVTVSVTGDAGAQATGSVGAGACTHEGNGYHTYAPAQAETNYDLVAFTFTGTGAVPQTVQVYTRAATPDVNVATFTANALTAAAINADAITAAKIAADVTTEIQTGLATAAALSTLDGKVDTIDNLVDDLESRLGTPSNLGSGATIAANLVDIEGQTDDIGVAGAGLTALATQASVDAIDDLLDTEIGALTTAVADIPTNAELATALGTADDATLAAISALDTKIDTIDNLLDTEVAAILADTNELQADWVNGGRLDLILDARASQASVDTIDDLLDTEVAALITAVDALPTYAELATALGTADDATLAAISALDTKVDTIDNLLDTEIAALTTAVADIPTNAELATALDPIPTAVENADALLGRTISGGANGGRTVTSAFRAIRNKVEISAGTLTVNEEDDATPAWTAAVTTSAGNPISAVDPV
jgi:hypothetical protein